VCANVSWDGNSLSIDVFLSIGGRTVLSKNISASQSICYGLPYAVDICIGVEDLYINTQNHTLSGCADLSAKILDVTVVDFKLGCFSLKYPGVSKAQVLKRSTEETEGTLCLRGQTHCCLYKGGTKEEPKIFYDAYKAPAVCPRLYAGRYPTCNDKCVAGSGNVEDCQALQCQ